MNLNALGLSFFGFIWGLFLAQVPEAVPIGYYIALFAAGASGTFARSIYLGFNGDHNWKLWVGRVLAGGFAGVFLAPIADTLISVPSHAPATVAAFLLGVLAETVITQLAKDK